MKHKPNPDHCKKLMGGHHKNDRSPEDILMRQHHASGGVANNSLQTSGGPLGFSGGMSNNTSKFSKGGKAGCFAKGGGVYAEGGDVEEERAPKKKGGRARRFMGGPLGSGSGMGPMDANGNHPGTQGYNYGAMNPGQQSGQSSRPMLGSDPRTWSPQPLKKGGRARRAEGGTMREDREPSREHHSFGDVVGKIGQVAGHLLPLLPMFLAAGGAARTRRGMGKGRGR